MIAGRMKDKKLINARGVMIISSMWFSSQLECSAVLPSPGTVEALNPSQRAPWHRGSLRLPCYEYDASIRQVRLLPMLWLLPISPRGQTPTMWIKCHLYLSSSTQYTCSNVKLEKSHFTCFMEYVAPQYPDSEVQSNCKLWCWGATYSQKMAFLVWCLNITFWVWE